MNKLKKLKMSVDDVVNQQIFSKEPYRFGKEIFNSVKEGE